MKKSGQKLKVAKLLYREGFQEDATSKIYYAMYLSVQAVFRRLGIKCKNHTVTAVILQDVLGRKLLSDTLKAWKFAREDADYHVSKQTFTNPKEAIDVAEDFISEIDRILSGLDSESVEGLRVRFKDWLKGAV